MRENGVHEARQRLCGDDADADAEGTVNQEASVEATAGMLAETAITTRASAATDHDDRRESSGEAMLRRST